MQVSRKILSLLFAACVLLTACQQDQNVIYDNVIYQIDTIPLYSSGVEKDKVKSPTQYISTLYTDLYFKPVPANVLRDLSLMRLVHGDKALINDMVVDVFLQDPEVQASIPSYDEMRDDVDGFVTETYLRFFLRKPNGYELFGMREMIEESSDLEPIEVYRAFLLSNEYLFY